MRAPAASRGPALRTSTQTAPGLSPLCGSKRELCTRFLKAHSGLGAPRARPPERSGATGPPRAEAWGGPRGRSPPDPVRLDARTRVASMRRSLNLVDLPLPGLHEVVVALHDLL